jgi:2-methylcitrate dehydratase PrpD
MATDQAHTTIAGRLARFVVDLRYEDLPEVVVHIARRALLDTLGAGISGATADEGQRLLAAVGELDRTEDVTVWGTSRRLSAPLAALVNGTMTHSLEMDDFGGCDHSGAVVVPAALAIAEHSGRGSGHELLASIVAGYELARRPMEAAGGYPAHNQRGWHSTGTCGSFGAAAAAARLLGLDVERTTWALGLAGTFTGGTWAFLEDGAMSKRLHPGKAAENGVLSAYLASRGFTGPTRIFEAAWGGFLATYAPDEGQAELLTAGLGEDYRILRTGFKPYASCRGVHSSIDALLSLRREHQLEPDEIKRVVVRANPFDAQMVGNTNVETMLDAQMSLPYGLAVTLLSGRADISQYTPEKLSSPEVREALSRITMSVDSSVPNDQEPLVELHLRDGRVLSARVDVALGAPENPLNDDALIEKFRGLAGLVLPGAQVERLVDVVWRVDEQPDLRELIGLLRAA